MAAFCAETAVVTKANERATRIFLELSMRDSELN
jgi:hypothetical protein